MVSLRQVCGRAFLGLVAVLLMAGVAHATPIYLNTLAIASADPTQLGRLSRDGIPSDWSSAKPFPGDINTTTSYHYRTLDLNIAALESGFTYGGFIQINFDSASPNTFLSAYLNSYNPASKATNYLGDAGFSGDPFPGDPGFFQVFVPSGNHLLLLLNETTTNAGLNQPGDLLVEAFADTEFTDLAAAPVPEPGTLALIASGVALLKARRHRRRAAAHQ